METTVLDTGIAQKTRELCQTILDQPDFSDLKKRMDAFLNDELVKFQYQTVSERGNFLQMKQNQGMPVSHDEITAFQKMRDDLLANPVAKGFLDAQMEMQRVQDSVTQHLAKTFELGRLPTDGDLNGGGCSSGCGCH